jgi:hypothetical protein
MHYASFWNLQDGILYGPVLIFYLAAPAIINRNLILIIPWPAQKLYSIQSEIFLFPSKTLHMLFYKNNRSKTEEETAIKE